MKSWIEISAGALRANFRAVQAVAGPRFAMLVVIKADAYGHGAELCAPVLVEAGAEWLGVGDLEEGLRVRSALARAGLGERGPRLLVMCGFEPEDAPAIVEAGLIPVVWTAEHVDALQRAAEAAGDRVRVRVHVEVDTGMARQGARPGAELAAVLARLARADRVRWEGLFSHLSSSEIVDSTRTREQEALFWQAIEQAYDQPLPPEYLHLGNSSAVDEGTTINSMRRAYRAGGLLVRPGLALYGYALELDSEGLAAGTGYASVRDAGDAMPGMLGEALRPVATWKTRVIGLRKIAAGDTVGYGATFVAGRPMRLALLPVGYADGFRREASSGVGDGWVVIGGQRAPVVGRVSMNLTVVDVTGNAGVCVGDEVVLLGEGVTAEDHARWCGTISYEILCGMRGHRRLV